MRNSKITFSNDDDFISGDQLVDINKQDGGWSGTLDLTVGEAITVVAHLQCKIAEARSHFLSQSLSQYCGTVTRCPACETVVTSGIMERFESRCEHVENPNEERFPRPTWICENEDCIAYRAGFWSACEGDWYDKNEVLPPSKQRVTIVITEESSFTVDMDGTGGATIFDSVHEKCPKCGAFDCDDETDDEDYQERIDYNLAIDGIAGMILACAGAGVNISAPRFHRAVFDAVQGAAANI